jgi:choline-sulfatase
MPTNSSKRSTPLARSFPAVAVALAAAVATALGSAVPCSGAEAKARTSLLLITTDTVRADHLALYGYGRPTSPHMEALAKTGACFLDAISPIPQTGPACASILTGRWPASLGLHGNAEPLGPGPRTVAEILGPRGFSTAGLVSGFPLIRKLSGLDRGFAHFDDDMPDPRGAYEGVQRRGAKTTALALKWLDARPAEKPFFLWVHYYDPHGDYHPGGPFETMFAGGAKGPMLPADVIPDYQRHGGSTDAADNIARYDGEVRYVDEEVGKLLAGLEARGLTATTLVALSADHGENMTEHGYYFDHGNEVYIEAVHVPLIVAGPGVPSDGRRIKGLVRLPDLMPTLLDLLGVDVPKEVEGRSLAGALASGAVSPPRECFSEARVSPAQPLTPKADVTEKLAVRDDRFTVLWRKVGDRMELYDRTSDPGETHNLLSKGVPGPEEKALGSSLRVRVETQLEARSPGESLEVISPELRARLERIADRKASPR